MVGHGGERWDASSVVGECHISRRGQRRPCAWLVTRALAQILGDTHTEIVLALPTGIAENALRNGVVGGSF